MHRVGATVAGMDAVQRFTRVAAVPEKRLNLDHAALALAAGADRDLDVDRWLAELDRLAAGVDGVDGLRRRLFRELGYRGNTSDYHDPANSLLHQVIQRRVGIPISLSVLTMEVGRRAGVRLEGVGMPGHFLVRLPGTATYLDPFHGGELLDERGCEARFRAATGAGAQVAFDNHLLATATKREILARMLANLRAVYLARGAVADLEWVLRMRLALPDAPASHISELGRVLTLQGKFLQGAATLERDAGDHPHLAQPLQATARALRARLN